MGPTVWEEEGPMPMRMRSKTLSGRGACSTSIAPARRAAGVAESRAVEMRAVSGARADTPAAAGLAESAGLATTGGCVEMESPRLVTSP